VFPARYELNFYISLRRKSIFESLIFVWISYFRKYIPHSYVRYEFHWLRNTGTIVPRLKCLFCESECHDVPSVDDGGWKGAFMLLRHTNIFNILVCTILAATNPPTPSIPLQYIGATPLDASATVLEKEE
jgi:hypothetical protein